MVDKMLKEITLVHLFFSIREEESSPEPPGLFLHWLELYLCDYH